MSNSLQLHALYPPGSSVHEILQARILEWVAIAYFRGSSLSIDQTCICSIFYIGRWILYQCTTWETLWDIKFTS